MSTPAIQPLQITDSHAFPRQAMGVLQVDTKKILQNYKTLQSLLPQTKCGAVLKADAYGFGMNALAPLLKDQGCEHFFLAHIEEGIDLRKALPAEKIYIFSGLLPNTEADFIAHNLIPVLNDFRSLKAWEKAAKEQERKLPCVLHFDTGMHRNGFDSQDLSLFLDSLDSLNALDVHFTMSHLACSNERENSFNQHQHNLFESLRSRLPSFKSSLADTGGIFLGPSFHYDIARPGKGLFGLFETPKNTPPLLQCLKLYGRILQIRAGKKGESIGYGGSFVLSRPSRLATIGVGFADGYNRQLSNKGHMEIQGFKAPIVGRISMDYTVIDITDIPESLVFPGGWAELINDTLTLDSLGHCAHTISREISTCLGNRFHCIHV